MTAIGVYNAKTQLPKLLDRVSRGELREEGRRF